MENLYNQTRELTVSALSNVKANRVIQKKIDAIGNMTAKMHETLTNTNKALDNKQVLSEIEGKTQLMLNSLDSHSASTDKLIKDITEYNTDLKELEMEAKQVSENIKEHKGEVLDEITNHSEIIQTQMSNIQDRIEAVHSALDARNEIEEISQINTSTAELRETIESISVSNSANDEKITNELDTLELVLGELTDVVADYSQTLSIMSDATEKFAHATDSLDEKVATFEPEIRIDTTEDVEDLFGYSDKSLNELINTQDDLEVEFVDEDPVYDEIESDEVQAEETEKKGFFGLFK
jgi:chromosome segregation ATPase